MVAPCAPVFGFTRVMTGVAALTVKPLTRLADSPPVVAVTLRRPGADDGLMVMLAVAWVGSVTVTELIVIWPSPKLTLVVPDAKFVFVPTIAMPRLLAPWLPLFGVRVLIAAGPAVTLKPLISVTTSPPMVMVTLRKPVFAVGVMVTETVALVELLTVTELTVMPVPKFAVVVF